MQSRFCAGDRKACQRSSRQLLHFINDIWLYKFLQMRIIITRHGETEENKRGIVQGHLPGVLSDLGKEQARKLAERLKGEDIDLIISSDLTRALDTAKAIGEFHPDVEIVLDERLKGRYKGDLQGTPKKESNESGKGEDVGCDGVGEIETLEEFSIRNKELAEEIRERSEENIFLVGHNGTCKSVIEGLMGMEDGELKGMGKLKNASVSIIGNDKGKMEMKLLNCVEHLA